VRACDVGLPTTSRAPQWAYVHIITYIGLTAIYYAVLNIHQVIFAHNVPANMATRKGCAFKVTQVVAPGAQSAVFIIIIIIIIILFAQ